jgi:hypothetical protein
VFARAAVRGYGHTPVCGALVYVSPVFFVETRNNHDSAPRKSVVHAYSRA